MLVSQDFFVTKFP